MLPGAPVSVLFLALQASAAEPPPPAPTATGPAASESAPEQPPATDPPAQDGPVAPPPEVPVPAPSPPVTPAPVPLPVPTVEPEPEPEPSRGPSRRSGQGSLVLWGGTYGAYLGGTTGFLIGEATEATESDHVAEGIPTGVVLGAAAGATTAAIASRGRDVSREQAFYLWSGSGVGVFYGTQLGRALIAPQADGSEERVVAAGIAGSMAGTGIALATQAPTLEALLHFDLATGIGAIAGTGVANAANLDLPTDRQARAGINLLSAGAFGATAALNSSLGGPSPSAGAWALSLGHGAWLGGMTPLLFTDTPSARQSLGGVQAGLGAGYAGALLLAAVGNPDARSVAMQTVGFGTGTALGAGIPLSLGEPANSPTVIGPMLASGITGQVVGALVAPQYDIDGNDGYLLGTVGAWTTFQAAGWATYANATGTDGSRALGYALTTGGAGALVGVGLAPVIDLSPSGSAMLLAGGGWGTWYGGWSSVLIDADPDAAWLTTLTTGNAAFVGTAIAEGAGWDPSWTDVGLINGVGLLGGAGGAMIGVIALYDEDNPRPLVGAVLAGSTAGLAAGAVLAIRTDDSSRGRLAPVQLGRSRYRPHVRVLPWISDEREPGLYGEVRLDELGRR